ncbi:SLAP domain-containing protein [Piscibacillus salipiscarius]|uniref:SLAP domain-containing protein n=1 Tax=Piscibacillus salipiscarius TaxID=299480 RepID=UPI0006D09633|nr:SLAP domain-containing protein [Piscibacillus salipiscarius]
MQQLQFEEKWDKTISDQDRRKIEEVFEETKNHDDFEFEPVTLWQANNHKDELLVTALLHNRSDKTVSFNDVHITYKTLDAPIAERDFNIPRLQIPPDNEYALDIYFPRFKSR